MTTVRVHLDTSNGTMAVGTALLTRARGVDITEFTYDESFLSGPGWTVSPDLPIHTGRSVVEGLPGALEDSAPDMWGRNLITRRLAAQARSAGQAAATPTDLDYLLGVHDLTRQGALRFSLDDGPFLAESDGVPQLLELEALLEATRQVADGTNADDAVMTLLAAGSGSLGGARPKASVVDGATLHVAKFPHPDDPWEVIRWEAVALDLAAACGLRTPPHRLVEAGGDPILLIERFDRFEGGGRIPYLSASSLVGRPAGTGDYLEVVDALTEHGSDVNADLVELWRRIAFSVAINNVDDHLRNHAVLRAPGGWRLSPVFDVNPDRRPATPRATSVAGATAPDDCRRALLDNADRFGLDLSAANQHWNELVATITEWRTMASRNGISGVSQGEFAPALDRWSAVTPV